MTTPANAAPPANPPAPTGNAGGGGGGGNVFTRKLGPMPVWGWMGVGLAVALGYYFWQKNKAANSTSSTTGTTGTTDQNLVPQFVNQVYDNSTPPDIDVNVNGGQGPPGPPGPPGPTGKPPPPPPPQQLTRTWTSEGGSTLASVMGRLGTKVLTPSNTAAKNWIKNVYSKNHNAKMPRGLVFTYTEGTVTNKPGQKKTPIPIDKTQR